MLYFLEKCGILFVEHHINLDLIVRRTLFKESDYMTTIEQFLNWLHDEGKDSKTIIAYQTILHQFTEWYVTTTGLVTLTEVKPIDVKEFIGYLRHTLNRKPATINKAIAGLKTFFSYLADIGLISDNPMTRIKIQKIQATDKVKDTMKWLTKEEQERFLSYIDLEKNEFKRLRNLAIVDLMLYGGLRVSEVVELKIEDIKANGNIEVTIREGKYSKYANVTIVSKYAKNLRNWLKYRQKLTNEKYLDSPYLFVSERTGQLGARGIQVMLDKYAELAGMDNMTPHRLRHSYCKNLANASISIQTIADLARHSNINTTRIYVENSEQERLNALNKM